MAVALALVEAESENVVYVMAATFVVAVAVLLVAGVLKGLGGVGGGELRLSGHVVLVAVLELRQNQGARGLLGPFDTLEVDLLQLAAVDALDEGLADLQRDVYTPES